MSLPSKILSTTTWRTALEVWSERINALIDHLAAVLPQGEGAWQTYTPTLTDLTIGSGANASLAGRYTRVGKKYTVRIDVGLGVGFTIGSDPRVSLPVTGANGRIIGYGVCRPSGGTEYAMRAATFNSTTVRIRAYGTNGQLTALSTSNPATAADGGWVTLVVIFEAA